MSGAEPARLRVDPISCHAHGLCAELLPELVRLDEWGYPVVEDPAVPPSIRGPARAAVAACPTLALRLEQRQRQDHSHSRRTHRRHRLWPAILLALGLLAVLLAGPVVDQSLIGGGSVVGEAPPDPGDAPALDEATVPEPLWPTRPPNIESDD